MAEKLCTLRKYGGGGGNTLKSYEKLPNLGDGTGIYTYTCQHSGILALTMTHYPRTNYPSVSLNNTALTFDSSNTVTLYASNYSAYSYAPFYVKAGDVIKLNDTSYSYVGGFIIY